MMVALVVAGTSSCRKYDVHYIPVGGGPSSFITPDVFADKPLIMMTEREIRNHSIFPASIMPKLGEAVTGDAEYVSIGLELISLLLDLPKPKPKSNNEFQEIKQSLDSINGQLKVLSDNINAMGEALSIDMGKLTSLLASADINAQVVNIQAVMDPGSPSGLLFYSNAAANYYADSTNPDNIRTMDLAIASAPQYAQSIYSAPQSSNMTHIILSIKDDILPSSTNAAPALAAFENTLVPLFTGASVVRTNEQAMEAYSMLESYFLTAVNVQFQAAIVYLNACNVINPGDTRSLDSIFWCATVVPSIKPEVTCFLSTVDSLVANLNEYRDINIFQHDMGYAAAGIAPDELFGSVLARAQLVANEIYSALYIPYPVMCGHVFIPHDYAFNPLAPLNLVIGSNAVSANPMTVTISRIPYTSWDQTNTCHPDYRWNVYHFESYEDNGNSWPDGKMNIQVQDNSSIDPWVHYSPITGSVTIRYYNPANLTQFTTTKTALCTLKLGFFSAAWPWGSLLLSNSQITNGWKPLSGAFDFTHFNKALGGNSLNVPFEATGSKSDLKRVTTNKFSYPYNTAGAMWWTGTTPSKSDYYAIGDAWTLDVATGSEVPADRETGISDTLQAWGYYKMYYNMPVDSTCFVNIGFSGPGNSSSYVPGNVVTAKFNLTQADSACNAGTVKINTGKSYTAGVQYYFETPKFPVSVPAYLKFQQGFQFVYRGYNTVQ